MAFRFIIGSENWIYMLVHKYILIICLHLAPPPPPALHTTTDMRNIEYTPPPPTPRASPLSGKSFECLSRVVAVFIKAPHPTPPASSLVRRNV